MDQIEVERLADPDLSAPVMIEGLPGVGHVGKLVVEHLLSEFESELVARVYADEFPPQVTIDDEGVAQLACAEFHTVTVTRRADTGDETEDADTDADAGDETEDADADDGSGGGGPERDDETGTDLLLLSGDHQAGSNAGHYRVADAFLDVAADHGVERVFALGGVPTGELVEEPDVLGAVADASLKPALTDAGVEFRADEPAGGIVGVSGLLLGLGGRRGFDVGCLMGETSGYLVDPKSARAVLEVLQTVVGFDVGYDALEERAEEMEEVVGKLQEMQEQQSAIPADDDLRYIG
jgi:hypothetical protein